MIRENLSNYQLKQVIDTLNQDVYESIQTNDISALNQTINTFEKYDYISYPNFALIRDARRFTKATILVDGVEVDYIIDEVLQSLPNGYGIGGLNAMGFRSFAETNQFGRLFPRMVSRYDNIDPKEFEEDPLGDLSKRMDGKRTQSLLDYIELLSHLYDFSIPNKNTLIVDDKAYFKYFVDRVVELVELRQNNDFIFNIDLLENDKLKISDFRKMSDKDKISYLQQAMMSKYDVAEDKKQVLTYNRYKINDRYVLITNYMRGKQLPHTNWKNYKNKQELPNNIWYYLELAFFLKLPSSKEIEKFLNLHGYSLNSDMCILPKHKILDNKYHVRYRDIKKWIDFGVDYDLINKLFGFELVDFEERK